MTLVLALSVSVLPQFNRWPQTKWLCLHLEMTLLARLTGSYSVRTSLRVMMLYIVTSMSEIVLAACSAESVCKV